MIVEFLLCVVTAPLTPVVDRLLNSWGATSSNNFGIECVSDIFLDEHISCTSKFPAFNKSATGQ